MGISSHDPTTGSQLRAALDKSEAENAALREENRAQAAQIEQLALKIADLEKRLGRNSSNSSLPPSSDRERRPTEESPNRAARRAMARKPGKQPGAPGSHLAQVEHPDKVVLHSPECCGNCGRDLADAEVESVEVRQVFDLPAPTMTTIEHRSEKRRCKCGTFTKAEFPPEARAHVSYGPRLRAYALYLLARQHLPFERAAEAICDMFGVSVSTGFLDSLYSEGANGLEAFLVEVLDQLRSAEVVHFDETSDRLGNTSVWYHVASTELLTLLHADETRGIEGVERVGLFPDFAGVAVHDRLGWYFRYDKATHAVCGAHLLRNLASVGVVRSQQAWASDMAALLIEMKLAGEEATAKARHAIYWRRLNEYSKRYDSICQTALRANPAPASGRKRNEVERESFNLATAFVTHKDAICRFATDLRVPFTNNLAERDLRMAKLHRKISGGFVSMEGAERLATVRSYLSTARKQGAGQMAVLTRLFAGDAWIPQRT